MGERKRGPADGQRGEARSASVAILYIARVVTSVMIIGGLGLAIWMYVWSREVIATYPVEPDNDVTRGFFVGMAGGLGIAGLSVVTLIGLSRGRRWGGIVHVFQWVVIWLPFSFGLQQFSADAFAISTTVSLVGALVGVLAFVAAPRGRLPKGGFGMRIGLETPEAGGPKLYRRLNGRRNLSGIHYHPAKTSRRGRPRQ
jgi:nitrate reductase NapE component